MLGVCGLRLQHPDRCGPGTQLDPIVHKPALAFVSRSVSKGELGVGAEGRGCQSASLQPGAAAREPGQRM